MYWPPASRPAKYDTVLQSDVARSVEHPETEQHIVVLRSLVMRPQHDTRAHHVSSTRARRHTGIDFAAYRRVPVGRTRLKLGREDAAPHITERNTNGTADTSTRDIIRRHTDILAAVASGLISRRSRGVHFRANRTPAAHRTRCGAAV